MDMIATVTRINVPAYSTLGYGEAVTDDGSVYAFVGDHRPMRHLGEALRDGEEPEIDTDEAFVLSISKVDAQPAVAA
jgi:hypothetical protein